jgi:hypothetical protein
MINALVLLICLLSSPVFAESLSFEVDDKGQTYSEIRLYMANIPRDFDLSAPPIYVGQAKRFTVSNLVVGQTYKFAAVLAWTGPGVPFQSELSNIVQQKIVADAPVTLPIPTVTVLGVEGGAIFTFGNLPEGVMEYLVKVAPDPQVPDTNVGTLFKSPTNPVTATGLAGGKKYNFYVRYNAAGKTGPRSPVASFTTPTVLILKAPGLLIIKPE